MHEIKVGKMVCSACGEFDTGMTEDDYFVKYKQRCFTCGSGLITWTPHTTRLFFSEKPMTADTGEGRKDDVGKLRYDLLPSSLEEVVFVYTQGAKKYADRNWEKGLKWSRVFGAMMRHGWAWWWAKLLGKNPRHENGMHHLGSVAWCALALMEYERTHPDMDDRPFKE